MPHTTQGAIGDALRADIHETGGSAEHHAERAVNSFAECEAFLHKRGHEFGEEYLRQLYRAAATKAQERYLRE